MRVRKDLFAWISLFLLATLVASCTRPATPAPSPTRTSATPAPETGVSTPGPAATTLAKAAPVPAKKEPAKPAPTPAPSGAYFEGKTIEILVSGTAGGGNDATARIVASFLPRYIPGNPRIVVRNQPGGEGTILNNSFAQRAKPDGLTLASNSSSQITIAVTRPDIAHYDPSRYEHVGHIARSTSLLNVRKDALNRLTDPTAKPVNVGAREGNETWAAMPMWSQEFLGWNLKWILGFGGTSEIELAIRRGEIDMFGTATERTINAMVREGIIVPLAQEGIVISGKLVRRPDFPDVPLFEEVLGNKKPLGLPWQAYQVWTAATFIDKWFSAPPGTPPVVMTILRDAWKKMAEDSQFDAMVKRTVSPIYTVGVGDETAAVIKDVLAAPPEAYKYGTDLQRKFGITQK